jgi:hypothetical protein
MMLYNESRRRTRTTFAISVGAGDSSRSSLTICVCGTGVGKFHAGGTQYMMGQIRASHYNICNHHDGIMGSFVLPFPLLSLAFSYTYRNVYDVSRRKRDSEAAYGSGRSYTVLAGKDGSCSWTVSISSLRTDDAVADCGMLKEKVCCERRPSEATDK